MTRTLFIFTCALLIPLGAAQADTLGFEVGVGSWSQDADGKFATDDISETAFAKGESATILWAAIEHPIPLVPNVRFARAPVKSSNSAGDSLDLDQTDLTLYYELLDNWVNLDLGLTARAIDGTLKVGSDKDSAKATIPMLYAKAKFDVPVSGLAVGTEINSIGVYRDIALFVAYETDFGLGIQAGKRTQKIDLDESDVSSSLTNDGFYAAAYFHF